MRITPIRSIWALCPFLLAFPCVLVSGGTKVMAAKQDSATPTVASTATNAFAIRMYRELAQSNARENVFFSPYSLEVPLSIAAHGARGETAAEMGSALSFPGSVHTGQGATPWDTAAILKELADVAAGLSPEDDATTAALRVEIENLTAQHRAALAEVEKSSSDRDWDAQLQKTEIANALTKKLNEKLRQVDQYEVRIANALWCEQTYPFNPQYIEGLQAVDNSTGLFAVDFVRGFEAARIEINDWTEEKTNGRIKELLPDGSVSDMTRLVISNAIYFKGEWAEPFDEVRTKEESFFLEDGTTVPTMLMSGYGLEQARYAAVRSEGTYFDTPQEMTSGQTADLYPDEDGLLAVELPYNGDRLSMLLLVPQKPSGLGDWEQKLTLDLLNEVVERLEARELHVSLPRFGLETAYEMRPPLESMRMRRAFVPPTEPDGADFSAMSESQDMDDKLFISAVIHKAFLEVNEKGTEAAAATAVMMMAASAMPTTLPFVPTVRADRPFLFLIRDRESETVLFLGRCVAPD